MNLIVCGVKTLAPGEYGTPAILVDKDKHCDECGHSHDFEKCPECGAWIELGFGLMFGGFGEYKYCRNDKCKWTWKKILPDDEA